MGMSVQLSYFIHLINLLFNTLHKKSKNMIYYYEGNLRRYEELQQ